MKVTRRSENRKSGHLLISMPALIFLEGKRQQRGSHVVIDLIVRAVMRNGWRRTAREDEAPTRFWSTPIGTDVVL
jgi:hypothetical protein